MARDRKNPFPSSGITRPGVEVDVQVSLPSQGGALERIEELCRSVISHGGETVTDELGHPMMKGKPELLFLRGEFGSGKTLTLTLFYNDCRKGRIRVKEGKSDRKAFLVAIYQPLHAMVLNPMNFLDVMIQRLCTEVKDEIKEVVEKAVSDAEKNVVEKDELLKKIYIWRAAANAAVVNGADAIAIILDELEESVTDYAKYVDGYARLFSVIRQFTDRQLGPVITVLGVTPKAIDSLVHETKEALLRRAVTIDLPHLTSPAELLELAEGYDKNVQKYVDKDAFDVVYGLTHGNPGFSLAALHWAWEEMLYRNLAEIDAQLATEAVQSIAWKGERLPKSVAGLEVEAKYPSARRALDVAKRGIVVEVTPESVLKSVTASLDAIVSIRDSTEVFGSLQEKFEDHGVQLKAASVGAASVYSEPNVEFQVLLVYADSENAEEKNIADVLDVWSELNGDLIVFVMPVEAQDLRRLLDKVCAAKIYRGIEWREVVIPLALGHDDLREFVGLTKMTGPAAEIKTAERLVAEKSGLSARVDETIRNLRKAGKTIPYKWEVKGLTKEVQWGIYSLLTKRFTDEEFTAKDAIGFVSAHHDLVEETKAHYAEAKTGKYANPEDFQDKVTRDTVKLLDALVDQGFATRRGTDKYYIPPVIPYERELYQLVRTIRDTQKGRNPGTDELKNCFFGYSPKGNSIYAIAKGMEGKGYMQCIQEGPRRFYRSLTPEEHLPQAEISIKRAEKRISETISEKLKENKVSLEDDDFKRFVKATVAAAEIHLDQTQQLIEKAENKSDDDFHRLRLMSHAEVLALMAIDGANTFVGRWLEAKRELSHAKTEMERYLKVADNSEVSKRLSKPKAAEIKGLIEEVRALLDGAEKKLTAFNAEGVESMMRNIQSKFKTVEQRLVAELKEFGKAEMNIRIAEEAFKEIADFISRNKEQADKLELSAHMRDIASKITLAKKAVEEGKMVHISVDSLPIFLRKATDDKVPFVRKQLEALKQAEELLNALGQSPAADQLVSSIKQTERFLERAERNEMSRNYDGYIENLAVALSQVDSQKNVFDRLRTLLMGAARDARSKFKTAGVDKAIADELHIEQDRARQLRHLLENQNLIKCLDIEVGQR